MRTYPHQTRKETCRAVMLILIISVIAMALFGCSKSKPLDTEPPPTDHSIRERQFKLVYPDYGIGCDTSASGGL